MTSPFIDELLLIVSVSAKIYIDLHDVLKVLCYDRHPYVELVVDNNV